MRRRGLLVLMVLALAAAGGWLRSSPSSARVAAAPSPIRHVVVIDMENHSFDNVLGKLCAEIASGAITGHAPCDGATSGKLADGTVIPLAQATDLVPDVSHRVASQQTAIDQGKMDGFSRIVGCTATTGYACYSQFAPSQIPNLAALAERFTISDRTFEFASTPSWGGHMVLASATLDGFSGDNPKASTFTSQTGPGWGCDSFKDASWWNGTSYVSVPSCVPDRAGKGPYRSSPVPYVPTIFDRLDRANLTWKIYGGVGGPGESYAWTICPTFYECLGSSQRSNLVSVDTFVADASAGTLPSLSIVTPLNINSQHNGFSMAQGDNWLGTIVSAIEQGPNWGSSAIFIVYDDCGCFYDHVPPPSSGTGIREPLVIVSPDARAGFTDSNTATFLSLLAYTEHTFRLTALTRDDSRAYDFADSFDYKQTPLRPAAMTTTKVPPGEKAWIRAHPADPDDPT
jgi:phospholipase C